MANGPEAQITYEKMQVGDSITLITDTCSKCRIFWEFGDNMIDFGSVVIHKFFKTGIHEITLTIFNGTTRNQFLHVVEVVPSMTLTIADPQFSTEINFKETINLAGDTAEQTVSYAVK